MFCGYLFLQAPVPWLDLMAERHVMGFVGFDGSPAPIAEHEITKLKNMTGHVPHRHSVNPHRAIRNGERAEITFGPFSGQIVTVENLYGSKARIFMNLFGTQKLVEIPISSLEAA
jgi:transcription antitermination factor NusG